MNKLVNTIKGLKLEKELRQVVNEIEILGSLMSSDEKEKAYQRMIDIWDELPEFSEMLVTENMCRKMFYTRARAARLANNLM